MFGRLLALALATLPASCTVYHHCNARDRALLDETATPPSQIPARATAVRYRVVPDGDATPIGSIAIFAHASQYRPAAGVSVDFDHEEVVRVAAPGFSGESLHWVAETADEVLVGITVAPTPCTAYPSPPLAAGAVDLVIPLTVKPVRVVSHQSGPSCELHGQP
jgi:hypothetical protein